MIGSEIKIRKGKFKGTMLKDVPIDYLKWCIDNNIFKGKSLLYAKIKTNYPKNKYEVSVSNSLNTDGVYIVESYSIFDAICVCKRENNIQVSQSGTSFTVISNEDL